MLGPESNQRQKKEKIILGVDPGTNILGYAILKINGKDPSAEQIGILRLEKYERYELKLKKIQERILQIIKHYHPDELAIEAPFYGKNAQSMLKLGRAQGVVIGQALALEIPFTEYAPKKVKQSVSGNGNASKEQIAGVLCSIFKLNLKKDFELDATDALAVALCHHYQGGKPTQSKKASWENFLKENKGRQINP